MRYEDNYSPISRRRYRLEKRSFLCFRKCFHAQLLASAWFSELEGRMSTKYRYQATDMTLHGYHFEDVAGGLDDRETRKARYVVMPKSFVLRIIAEYSDVLAGPKCPVHFM